MKPLAIVKGLNLFKYGWHCLLPSLVRFWSTSLTFNEWKKFSDTAFVPTIPPTTHAVNKPQIFYYFSMDFWDYWLFLPKCQIRPFFGFRCPSTISNTSLIIWLSLRNLVTSPPFLANTNRWQQSGKARLPLYGSELYRQPSNYWFPSH